MTADLAEHGLSVRNADGGRARGAALRAQAATRAVLGVHDRDEHRVTADAARMHFDRERLLLLGAGAVAHLAAKSLMREARGGVDDGDAHAGVADAGERRRERTRRAGLHAGDVLAHVAGDLLGNEEGRAAAKYILVSSAVVCDKLHLRTGVHYRHILLFI